MQEKIGIHNFITIYTISRKENDKICFVFDRDLKSFTCKQYEEVVSECKSKNYNLYILNPYFELWLLSHFDISNREVDIRKNEQQTKEKRFIEHTLSQCITNFNSSKL